MSAKRPLMQGKKKPPQSDMRLAAAMAEKTFKGNQIILAPVSQISHMEMGSHVGDQASGEDFP
jgi:hypothetical protein